MPRDAGLIRLALLGFLASAIVVVCLWAAVRWLRRKTQPMTRLDRTLALSATIAAVTGLGCFGWAFIEADWLSETRIEVVTPKLSPGRRIRIVHVSDLHIDRARGLFRELAARINALEPDLFIFTGDSLNTVDGLSPFRELLGAIHAPMGRFAVRGNHDVVYWAQQDLFGGGVARELDGTLIPLDDAPVSLCGAAFGNELALRDCVERSDPAHFVIAAYHTPDLIQDFARRAPDLYLAGHTHGGQVRIPFYGAVVTLSRFDKQYEMGRYEFGATTLFVSRGVGVEPGAPRIRFNCRPELAVIDLRGR